jgi:hypothetical protein
MTYLATYDQCEDELPDVAAARAFLETQPLRIALHGGRASSYWFAPAGVEDVLRLDIDYDNGQAALRWLPDDTYAVELDVIGPIVVLESSDYDVVTIPAELARVSVDTAHQAVIEYISTGQKPTCVRWQSASATAAA